MLFCFLFSALYGLDLDTLLMLVKCLKLKSICFQTFPGHCPHLLRPGSSFFPVPVLLFIPLRFLLGVGCFSRRAPWQVTLGSFSRAALGVRQLLLGAQSGLAHVLGSHWPLGSLPTGYLPARPGPCSRTHHKSVCPVTTAVCASIQGLWSHATT